MDITSLYLPGTALKSPRWVYCTLLNYSLFGLIPSPTGGGASVSRPQVLATLHCTVLAVSHTGHFHTNWAAAHSFLHIAVLYFQTVP